MQVCHMLLNIDQSCLLTKGRLQSCPYSLAPEIPIQCWFCWLQLISSELILDPFHVLILHYAASPLSRYHCLSKKHLFWCNNTHKFCLHINQTMKERDGVATIVYYGELRKTNKRIRKGLRTGDELKSRLRVGKVLTPHSACPKTIPLIKWGKSNVVLKMFIFPKI